jgi:hypothetical protein
MSLGETSGTSSGRSVATRLVSGTGASQGALIAAGQYPDYSVAWSQSSEKFLLVWEESTEIFAQFFDESGNAVFDQLTIAQGGGDTQPAVSFSVAANKWLISWVRNHGANRRSIDGRFVVGGAAQSRFRITPQGSALLERPGTAYFGPDSSFLVAWSNLSTNQIHGRWVEQSGPLTRPAFQISSRDFWKELRNEEYLICSQALPRCLVTWKEDDERAGWAVRGRFVGPLQSLAVAKAGTGSGFVSTFPAGIACGPVCTADYLRDTVVDLFAAPDADTEFTGWSGDPDCSDGRVIMSSDKSCTADFSLKPLLTIIKDGSGTGFVTSSPPGIACGDDCDQRYSSGTVVQLTATADAGSRFAGWGGHSDCIDGQVTMSEDRTCRPLFVRIFGLTVLKSGSGTGTVTSSPSGIACGSDCFQYYDQNTIVHLWASPDQGSEVAGWFGEPDCSDATVTMSQDRTCEVEFGPCSLPISVEVPPQTVTDTQEFAACNRLTAGDGGFIIEGPNGNVTFRADNTIVLESGFQVKLDATFAAVIGPPP